MPSAEQSYLCVLTEKDLLWQTTRQRGCLPLPDAVVKALRIKKNQRFFCTSPDGKFKGILCTNNPSESYAKPSRLLSSESPDPLNYWLSHICAAKAGDCIEVRWTSP